MAATKAQVRAEIRARRAARHASGTGASGTEAAGRLLAAARSAGLLDVVVAGIPPCVAAYIPSAGEPDVTAIVRSVQAAGGRVLLPIPHPARVLAWAFDDGRYVRDPRLPVSSPAGEIVGSGAAGLLEQGVRLVLVPALAVDRAGTRLGQGGGYYDTLLTRLDPGIRAVAVVDEAELRPAGSLPRDEHDQCVGWALTPSGLVALGV
ncbi:MAG: 5-formyltetrahydrofolate cyclo-ligase [Candidatus Nanopelagicales bacterium]